MIETKVNYSLVGAFVLLLGAVLIGGVLWIASGGTLQKKYDRYLAIEEESVAGLNPNAPVKYNGVEVGKVSDIRLDPADPARVRLTLSVERGTPIRADTVAMLKTQGLTGIAYVELSSGSRDAPPLLAGAQELYPTLLTKPSLSTRLETVLTTVMAKLDHTSDNIDALLSDDNRAALSSTLADTATVARTIAANKAQIDAGMADAARAARDAARAMAQLGPMIGRIDRAAASIEKMGDDVALASSRTAQSVAGAEAEVEHFSAGTLPQVQRLLNELNDLSTSLRRLSDQLAHDPAGLLRGRAPVRDGPGEAPGKGPHR